MGGMDGMFRSLQRHVVQPIEDAIEDAAPHKKINELYEKFVQDIETQQAIHPLIRKVPSLSEINAAVQKLGIAGAVYVTRGRRGDAESEPVETNKLAAYMRDALEAKASGEYYLFDVAAN